MDDHPGIVQSLSRHIDPWSRAIQIPHRPLQEHGYLEGTVTHYRPEFLGKGVDIG